MTVNHILPDRIGDQSQAPAFKLARDAQSILSRIPVTEHRTVEEFYHEPIVMGGMREEPFCIECVRIVNLLNAQTNVTECTGFVNFTWLPNNGGAFIQNIGGLTVAANGGTKYRFYFRITYRMS
jgi:hypothetical protein